MKAKVDALVQSTEVKQERAQPKKKRKKGGRQTNLGEYQGNFSTAEPRMVQLASQAEMYIDSRSCVPAPLAGPLRPQRRPGREVPPQTGRLAAAARKPPPAR